MVAALVMKVSLGMTVLMDAQLRKAICSHALVTAFAPSRVEMLPVTVSLAGLGTHVPTGHVSLKALCSWARSTNASVRLVTLAAPVRASKKTLRGMQQSK